MAPIQVDLIFADVFWTTKQFNTFTSANGLFDHFARCRLLDITNVCLWGECEEDFRRVRG
jgi:hypothetical protein